MIVSFADKNAGQLFETGKNKRFSAIAKQALKRLALLDAASTIRDLQNIPSNHLEILKGDLKGFYSIRINNQWRVIFKWIDEKGAAAVKIVDYH